MIYFQIFTTFRYKSLKNSEKYKEKRQPDAESKLPECAECKISENCCRKMCFLQLPISINLRFIRNNSSSVNFFPDYSYKLNT